MTAPDNNDAALRAMEALPERLEMIPTAEPSSYFSVPGDLIALAAEMNLVLIAYKDRLAATAERADAWLEEQVAFLQGERDALASQLAEAERERDSIALDRDGWEGLARQHEFRRREAEAQLAEAREALKFYAERRNYTYPEKDGTLSYDGLERSDSYDDAGPGARARSALARLDSNSATQPKGTE